MQTKLLLVAAVLAVAVLAPPAAATAAPTAALSADDSASVPAPCEGPVCDAFNDLFCPWLACVA